MDGREVPTRIRKLMRKTGLSLALRGHMKSWVTEKQENQGERLALTELTECTEKKTVSSVDVPSTKETIFEKQPETENPRSTDISPVLSLFSPIGISRWEKMKALSPWSLWAL
jgi:hypothetical protein